METPTTRSKNEKQINIPKETKKTSKNNQKTRRNQYRKKQHGIANKDDEYNHGTMDNTNRNNM